MFFENENVTDASYRNTLIHNEFPPIKLLQEDHIFSSKMLFRSFNMELKRGWNIFEQKASKQLDWEWWTSSFAGTLFPFDPLRFLFWVFIKSKMYYKPKDSMEKLKIEYGLSYVELVTKVWLTFRIMQNCNLNAY